MTLLENAQAVLETGAVCDSCLGRCFADRSSGLTAAQRGYALRIVCAMASDEPYTSVEPADCWVCDGAVVVDYEKWTKRTVAALDNIEFETFQIGTHPPTTVVKNERKLRNQVGLPDDAGWTVNAVINREVSDRLARQTGATEDRERPDVVPVLNLVDDTVEVRINPIYLFGRYRKLEPGVTQRVRRCPVCDGIGTVESDDETHRCENCGGSGRRTSVEEVVAWMVRDTMDASEVAFHTAGGEADDVLMLGTGRPFILVIKEPRSRPSEAELEAKINEQAEGTVEVDELTFTSSDVVDDVTQQPFRQRFRLTMTVIDPVTASAFDDAVTYLDGSVVRRHLQMKELAKGQRPHEVVRTLQDVSGTRTDNRTATLELQLLRPRSTTR